MAAFKMNKYILLLLLSDVFTISGFGLIDPIFAVFASEHVMGGSLSAVGIAIGIFLITKSLVQLPFSRKIDNCDDQFDIRWLLIGDVLVVLAPVIYLFSGSIGWIFFAQFINGVGAGLAYPAWLGLWSTHLDKKRESFEWSFYSTVTGLVAAVAAVIGAYIANTYGFEYTFVGVIVLSLFGVGSILYLRSLNQKTLTSPRSEIV
jgi:DHA1 family quinolone resistance protein-like MFS transporter